MLCVRGSAVSLDSSARRDGSRERVRRLGTIMLGVSPPTLFAMMHSVNQVCQIVLSPFFSKATPLITPMVIRLGDCGTRWKHNEKSCLVIPKKIVGREIKS